ncbi:MAG: 7TM-DISM domain-containing protein [Microscillaceae bacterium]|nr:7TM-DISM domain-containing protein [Microscillaceae bacterium]
MLRPTLCLLILLEIGLLLGGLLSFGVKAQRQEKAYLLVSPQVVQLPAAIPERAWVRLRPDGNRLLASVSQDLPYDFFPVASYRYIASLELENQTEKSRKIYLDWGLVDQVFFRVLEKPDWQSSGFLEPYSRRAVPEGHWNQQLTYLYLPAKTRLACTVVLANSAPLPAKIPLRLFEEAAWENLLEIQHFSQGIFLGIMVLFSLCIIIVYLSMGEKLYLTFFLYAFLFALSRLPAYGYLGPLSPSPYTDEIWWLNLSQVSGLMLLLFTRQALQTSRFTPFYDKLILLLIMGRGLALLGGWAIILSGMGIDFVNVLVRWIDVLTLPLGLWITIFFAWKGSLLARSLVIGNFSVLSGLTFTLLGAYQILLTPFFPYFLQAGVLGQIFIICVGLGFRIQRRFEKEQKNQAKILVLQKRLITVWKIR